MLFLSIPPVENHRFSSKKVQDFSWTFFVTASDLFSNQILEFLGNFVKKMP
jgi:hypothetical protein